MAADTPSSQQSQAFASLQKSIERQKHKIIYAECKHSSDKATSLSKLKEFSDMLLKITNQESTLHEDCHKELQQLKVMNSGMSDDMECIKKEVEQMTKELEESKIIKEKLEQITKELNKSKTENILQHNDFTEKIRKMRKELEEGKKIKEKLEQTTKELEESKKVKEKLELISKELEESKTKNILQHIDFTEKIRKMRKELEESKKIKEKLEQTTKELEESKKVKEKLELISRELEESKSLNELQQKNFTEETRKNLMKISSLEMAAMKQQNEHKDGLKLTEDLKDKMEQLNAKTVQLEKQQKSKQKLELKYRQLKRKLEVMKNMEDDFLKTVGNLHTNLMEKEQSLQELQDYCQSVITKERQSNDELQKARKRMIEGIAGRSSRFANIGVKRMGQLDNGPFRKALRAKQRYYLQKAATVCSLWEKNLKDPHWYPFKIFTIGGELKEVIDEEDEKLKRLKRDMGAGPYQAVVNALTEMNEYNPSGRSVVSELWYHGKKRKATLEEGVEFLLGRWKTKKQKTHQTGTDDDSEDSDNDDDQVPPADNSVSDSAEALPLTSK